MSIDFFVCGLPLQLFQASFQCRAECPAIARFVQLAAQDFSKETFCQLACPQPKLCDGSRIEWLSRMRADILVSSGSPVCRKFNADQIVIRSIEPELRRPSAAWQTPQ